MSNGETLAEAMGAGEEKTGSEEFFALLDEYAEKRSDRTALDQRAKKLKQEEDNLKDKIITQMETLNIHSVKRNGALFSHVREQFWRVVPGFEQEARRWLKHPVRKLHALIKEKITFEKDLRYALKDIAADNEKKQGEHGLPEYFELFERTNLSVRGLKPRIE